MSMRLVREVVAPVLTGYLVVLGMLAAYRRALVRGETQALRARPAAAGWRSLAGHVIGTAAGGYAFFLLLVAVFYFVLGRHSTTLVTDPLVEGSLLTFAVVVPTFLLLSWVDGRLRRRRGSGLRG